MSRAFMKPLMIKNNLMLSACDNLEVLKEMAENWPTANEESVAGMKIPTNQRGEARQKMWIRLRVMSTFKFPK
jgi:hypothetical protein